VNRGGGASDSQREREPSPLDRTRPLPGSGRRCPARPRSRAGRYAHARTWDGRLGAADPPRRHVILWRPWPGSCAVPGRPCARPPRLLPLFDRCGRCRIEHLVLPAVRLGVVRRAAYQLPSFSTRAYRFMYGARPCVAVYSAGDCSHPGPWPVEVPVRHPRNQRGRSTACGSATRRRTAPRPRWPGPGRLVFHRGLRSSEHHPVGGRRQDPRPPALAAVRFPVHDAAADPRSNTVSAIEPRACWLRRLEVPEPAGESP